MVTKDDRIAILTDKRKGYCTDCWAKTHPGSTCQPKYFCKDAACKSAHGSHSALSCPKFLVEPSNTQTINAVTSTNNKCDLMAVALPTAVTISHNSNALKLAPEKRNVALMMDSGRKGH